MREQLFYAEATAQLARTKQTAIAEREQLTRLMGPSGDDIAFHLPERLPPLPAEVVERQEVEATAMRSRLDVQMAKQKVDGMAKNHSGCLRRRALSACWILATNTTPSINYRAKRVMKSVFKFRFSIGVTPPSPAPRPAICKPSTAPPTPR